MNALYNHANKQKQLLVKDLAKLEDILQNESEIATRSNIILSTQGGIQTTLISLKKTIEQYKQQYDNIIKDNDTTDESESEEILKMKNRLDVLNSEYTTFNSKFGDMKNKFDSMKKKMLFSHNEDVNTPLLQNRNTGKLNENPVNREPTMKENIFNNSYYHDEKTIFRKSNKRLDQILEMGSATLDDIMEQNQILSRVQGKMTSTLKTLGVNNETINKINKVVLKDKIRFYLSMCVFVILCVLIIIYLR
ncbi:related to Protein transport protein BOS1 [Hanseniaspora guilliermondii]|uniref:Protein transport protein BOS1 n=1 Tax=Hanseniaspora guilliermondii TaxID=56406 RepID=A0A1L0B1V8_9ASCO|nr:related to Protein transport protein BOS1 [Hanseniaspora guilliermondii]